MSQQTPTTKPAQPNPQVSDAVKEMYTGVANAPAPDLHFPVGREAAAFVGYPEQELDKLPEAALESFAGVNYPFMADKIQEGDTVLDIGSGSGTDLLLAAKRVGPTGRAFGLDFTQAMIKKAIANIEAVQAHHAFVLQGDAGDTIPLPDESVDVVTSNGVINLIPDKKRVFAEIHRVLKPGGHLQIADIVVNKPVAEACRANPELWAACITGAVLPDEYAQAAREAGLKDPEVIHRFDYFAGSPSESARKTASDYDSEAIVFTAQKE